MNALRQVYHKKQESTGNGYDDWTENISVGLDIRTKVEIVFFSKEIILK